MSKRCPDPETQFEVDEAILEYLIYIATAALLQDARARGKENLLVSKEIRVDLALQMVDSFLVVFQFTHLAAQVSAVIQFRLRLLRFTMLFTRRYMLSDTGLSSSAIEQLRKQHRDRAENILSNEHINLDLKQSVSENWSTTDDATRLKHRRRLVKSFAPHIPPDFYGSPQSLSLLDTLPLFMALSAAQNILQGNNVTELWMKLAARYMAQAIIEQYLVYGAEIQGVIKEGFAYGLDTDLIADSADSDELQIINLFWDEETERVLPVWKQIRDEHLLALLPPKGISLEAHLTNTEAKELSLVEFESVVVDFLESLLHAQYLPVLVQFERGEIAETSRKQSKALRQRVLGNTVL